MAKSPFPGMDPYLELHWRDVHHRFVTYSCDQIQAQLPPDLCARMEERVILAGDGTRQGDRYPDVRVFEAPGYPGTPTTPSAVATAEPEIVVFQAESYVETYLEIREVNAEQTLVTTIEFLSPSNKRPGANRDDYLQKLRDCRRSGVAVVQIDLTQAGNREDFFPAPDLLPAKTATYQACAERGLSNRKCEINYLPLAHPLPAIRIPLRYNDPDVVLELRPLVDQAYQNGRYDRLDYRQALAPPLTSQEAEWAEGLLRSAGKRSA
jgi:hypothetical protein